MEENNRMIEGWLIGYGVDVFGFADMSMYDIELVQLDNAIKDRLTFGVSFGIVLSKAVLDTILDGPNLLYLHHYRQLNYRLDMIGYFISKMIEEKGYRALPFAASQVVDWRNQKAHISHKKVGEIAGVGWIGRNNLLVHPVYGAHVRYNTVLTDMPFVSSKADKNDSELSCGSCRACIDACPAGAIGEDRESFNHIGCYEMLTQFKNKRNLGHHICGICIKKCRGKR